MKHIADPRKRRRRGLTLIETGLVLAIAALVLAGLTQLMSDAAETMKARTAADRLKEVTKAAEGYIRANGRTLMTLTAGGAVTVPLTTGTLGTLPNMRDGGYLPSSFQDANPFGQRHSVIVRQVTNPTTSVTTLEGLVTTVAGAAIPDRTATRIAQQVGGQGGFMLQRPLAGTAGQVVGMGGGWRTAASSWSAGGVQPTTGHVQAIVSATDLSITSDYLTRVDIGQPEANTMRTTLLMGNNSITNVGPNITSNDTTNGVIRIGPNISVPGYVQAGTYVTAPIIVAGTLASCSAGEACAQNGFRGPKFTDSDDPTYYVDPNGTTKLNTIDADVKVSGTAVSARGLTNVRLGDLLPRYVSYGGYLGSNGDIVPMPPCKNGGSPKIVLSEMTDSYAITPGFTWLYTPANGAGGPPYVNSISNPAGNTKVARQITAAVAIPFGAANAAWKIQVSGTAALTGTYLPKVVAMTYCSYGT